MRGSWRKQDRSDVGQERRCNYTKLVHIFMSQGLFREAAGALAHRLRGQQFPGQNFIQGRAEKDHLQRIEHRFARQVLRRGRRCWRRFSPGAANPLLVGTLLRFRSTNPDRFCEEFRPYYIEVLKATASELDDKDLKILESLQNPENFPCEQTRHEIVAQRDCRIYRFAALSEYWTFVSFDPTLATILQSSNQSSPRLSPAPRCDQGGAPAQFPFYSPS